MLVRIYLDGGRSWSSLYFYDVPKETADKIQHAFKLSALPRCWRCSTITEKNNVLEIKADFSAHVCFNCLKKPDENRAQWRKKACHMNQGMLAGSREGKIRAIEESIIQSKIQCCAENLKVGKCKNPFVVENLGRVLLPHLYSIAKQK